MTLKVLWQGMFQGAFKHQVLERGIDNVYYLKRADFQLPVPPLPTIEVPPEVIPDLREVYGIDADGTLYVMGTTEREAELGERRVRVIGGVQFGEAGESFAPVDHELGNPFYGRVALAPHGEIVLVSNMPDFTIYDLAGKPRVDRATLMGQGGFEVPADRPPFWVEGAGDVACGQDGFLVGGFPHNRVDYYTYDGKLCLSLRAFELGGTRYDFERMTLSKVAFGPNGRMLVATPRQLFIFDAEGRPQHVVETAQIDLGGGHADFHLWMAVDAEGRLWSQFYKGKEVAYAAFELPAE